jgi:hypothetical protein
MAREKTIDGHNIAVDIACWEGGVAVYKLYVDGELRDQSPELEMTSDWRTVARCSLQTPAGANELKVQGRFDRVFFGGDLFYAQLIYKEQTYEL